MIRIRTMVPDDIPDIVNIEKACFPNPRDALLFYIELRHPDVQSWVAANRQEICAYLIFGKEERGLHILNLAVRESHRRRGIAAKLLRKMLHYARRSSASALLLEVSENNVSARAFYAAKGFEICGREAGYYEHDGSDALQMIRKLEKK